MPVLRVLALALLILGLARPQLGRKSEEVMTEGVEAMSDGAAPSATDSEPLRWRSGFQRTLKELLEG